MTVKHISVDSCEWKDKFLSTACINLAILNSRSSSGIQYLLKKYGYSLDENIIVRGERTSLGINISIISNHFF